MPKPSAPAEPSLTDAPRDLVELGRVAGAYGVRGWLRIHPYAGNATVLLEVNDWWFKAPASHVGAGASSSLRHARVQSSRIHGAGIVAHIDELNDRTLAQEFKGWSVWVARSDFPPAQPDEYYWVDLIGCRLYGEEAGTSVLIGEVAGVMDNGAHAILQVARMHVDSEGVAHVQHDAKGRPIEVLVPFVEAHVHTVNLAERQLLSNWLPD